MAAHREIIVDAPKDKESHYYCDCGFDEYLGDTCQCSTCKSYQLPLEKCPLCNEPFVTVF